MIVHCFTIKQVLSLHPRTQILHCRALLIFFVWLAVVAAQDEQNDVSNKHSSNQEARQSLISSLSEPCGFVSDRVPHQVTWPYSSRRSLPWYADAAHLFCIIGWYNFSHQTLSIQRNSKVYLRWMLDHNPLIDESPDFFSSNYEFDHCFSMQMALLTNKVLKLLQASKQVIWAWATLQLCCLRGVPEFLATTCHQYLLS